MSCWFYGGCAVESGGCDLREEAAAAARDASHKFSRALLAATHLRLQIAVHDATLVAIDEAHHQLERELLHEQLVEAARRDGVHEVLEIVVAVLKDKVEPPLAWLHVAKVHNVRVL